MRKNQKIDHLIQLTRETTRTPLFWLLHDHHEQLSGTWGGNRVRWPVVCGWVAACGITDKQGRALQPGAVKMTWRRVCAAKAEEQAAKPALVPVRSPAVTRAPAMPQPVPAQDIPSAEERIRKMQETVYRRTGRPWPPSKA